jgi:Sel1 repeat
MLETMYVHCAHCGYDNSPEYRFCGMCGASLAHPPVATKTPDKIEPPAPREILAGNGNERTESVHGPSFLGLAEDPKTEFHYLYEDEQPRSHVGVIVFLLLVLGAAGYLGWQWKNGGFPFNHQSASNSGAPTSASPSEVAPAQTQEQGTHIDKPMTGGSGAEQTSPPQPQQGQSGASESKPPEQAPKANESASAAPPDKTPEKETAPENKAAEKSDQGDENETAAATPAPKARSPKQASVRTPIQKAAPATSPDADLEQSGEKYLYGTGVPQNCQRAESNLRTAATHGNSKAQTVLGTMYATGHCVGRDLPTAYRWFARALHTDPQNSRISADLQVLWRQMTPQEKQLATASGQ